MIILNNRNTDFIPKVNITNIEVKNYPSYISKMNFSKEMLDAVAIEEDEDYIILKLKPEYYKNNKIDEIHNYEHHLPYHIPKKPRDISAYLNSPYHKELADRYEKFSTSYKQDIIDEVMLERQVILSQYPEIKQLVTKIRQKSLYSYEDKVNQKIIDTNNDPEKIFINDIIGARHIPYALESGDDEHDLIPYTTYIQLTLSDMHSQDSKSSKYKLKLLKDYIHDPDKAKSNIKRAENAKAQDDNSKDDIEPKKYQSVHLIYYNKRNPNCCYEDQIRTPNMEFIAKRDSLVGHYNYKPVRIGEDSPLRVPKYTIITKDPLTGKDVIEELMFKDAFRHANHIPITVNGKTFLYAVSWEQFSEEETLLTPFIEEVKLGLNKIREEEKEKEEPSR